MVQMKKKIWILFGIFGFFAFICCVVWYAQLSEFEVFQSFTMAVGDYRRDDVRVIIYKNHNSQEMLKRVEDEVNWTAGGKNTEVVLRLYHSKREVRKGVEPYIIIHINYETDSYKIERK